MRTYELHATFKQVKRSDGRSAVAAAAYRSGSRLVDERTAEVCDYTRKGGVEHSAMFAPADAPEWATDRAQLWNAAEQKENRKNSMTARELEVGFPSEFNANQRREAGDMLAQRLADKFGVAVDIAYHEPSKVEGDHPNYHAHILFTSRAINKDGWEKKKYRDFNNDVIEIDGEKTTRGKATIKEWREGIADCFNEISEREGLEVKTEHLSFKERGIDKVATVKMGVAATQMERNGIATDRGNRNRSINKNNRARQLLTKALKKINAFIPKPENTTNVERPDYDNPRIRTAAKRLQRKLALSKSNIEHLGKRATTNAITRLRNLPSVDVVSNPKTATLFLRQVSPSRLGWNSIPDIAMRRAGTGVVGIGTRTTRTELKRKKPNKAQMAKEIQKSRTDFRAKFEALRRQKAEAAEQRKREAEQQRQRELELRRARSKEIDRDFEL